MANQVFFLLIAMLKLGIIHGLCNVVYLTQPPSMLECNPGRLSQIRNWNLQVQCTVAGSSNFEIYWYHNNTDGVVRRLGKGEEKMLSLQTVAEDFEDITASNSNIAYGIKSTITIEEKINSLEILYQYDEDDDYFESFYESLLGEYWCQVQHLTPDDVKRSNVMILEQLDKYANLPLCRKAQSERMIECADTPMTRSPSVSTHFPWNTTVVMPVDYYTSISPQFTPTPLESTVDTSTTPLTSTLGNEFPASSVVVKEVGASNTADFKSLSQSINKWEIVIVSLCIVVALFTGLAMMVISLSIIVHRKGKRQRASKARLAMSQFDNPTYGGSPDEYIEPIKVHETTTLDCTDNSKDCMGMEDKIEDTDTSIYYYTEPIKKKSDDEDYVEPATLCSKVPPIEPAGVVNTAEGLSHHQYQKLKLDTINYLSIYSLRESNESCSTRNTASSTLVAMSPLVTMGSIPQATEAEYDYINIRQ